MPMQIAIALNVVAFSIVSIGDELSLIINNFLTLSLKKNPRKNPQVPLRFFYNNLPDLVRQTNTNRYFVFAGLNIRSSPADTQPLCRFGSHRIIDGHYPVLAEADDFD